MKISAAVILCTLIAVTLPAAGASAATKPATRFGAMIAFPKNEQTRTLAARNLGVKYMRPLAAKVGAPVMASIATQQAAGFRLVLNIVNRGASNVTSIPATNLATYRAGVAKELDLYHPVLAVIENEEVAPKFFSGTPKQYLAMLAEAVKVAHARKIPVTNGGIVSVGIALATWYDLWSHGRRAVADEYARRTFPRLRVGSKVLAHLPDRAHPSRPVLAGDPAHAALLAHTRQYIAGFRKSGIDYVNFHWYQAGAWSLERSVDYLERATGKPAVTNEIGQYDLSPSTAKSILEGVLAEKLRYVIWYAGDGGGPAKSLVDQDGSLRSNGVAFRDFAKRFGAS